MWIIMGTSPQLPKGHIVFGSYGYKNGRLTLDNEHNLTLERGIETLATAAALVCEHFKTPKPKILCAADKGRGEGSRAAHAYLIEHIDELQPEGITFHYLFPDVDWHNKLLVSIEGLPKRPTLVADAGFMYVAKMSGYADVYDLFTPDVGEMAFLADEMAPHPFYTRGFLLDGNNVVPELLARARKHGNVAQNLIIKGSTDYVVCDQIIVDSVDSPSLPAMEAIGGTGDLVTGITTGLLAAGFPMQTACTSAVKINRVLAKMANPRPDTQVAELVEYLIPALKKII